MTNRFQSQARRRIACCYVLAVLILSGCAKPTAIPADRLKTPGIVGVTLISSHFAKSQVFYGDVLSLTRTKAKLEATDSADPRCDFNSERCFLTPRGQAVSRFLRVLSKVHARPISSLRSLLKLPTRPGSENF